MENAVPCFALFLFVYLLLGVGVLKVLIKFNRMNAYWPAARKLICIVFWLPVCIMSAIDLVREIRVARKEDEARRAAIADFWEDQLNGK